ncbi:MAG: hypothetical protein DME18_03380 [Verrucomicrobia bacterium]|nr:MAG: hypothetical protein DME18_03380 [Verrucomicrobiota bacterium]
MRLVVITLMVIAIVVSVIVSGAFSNGDGEIVEVRFGQEMEANVIDVEDEQHHRQYTHPPTCRSRLGEPTPRRVLCAYQYESFR